jgi:hypothetical protein
MKYALVKDGAIIKQREFDDAPPDLSPNKGKWLRLIIPPGPAVDAATQKIERVVTINPNNVTITFTVSDKPVGEARNNRKKEVVAEARSRVGELPAQSDFGIYDAARAAQAVIDGLPDTASVRAYNVVTSPTWP